MKAPPAVSFDTDALRRTICALVRQDTRDLSSRQLGVLLTCYLDEAAQTVRGLARQLNVSKPAITRALDRLEELQFAQRAKDRQDGRSVVVRRTATGGAFLRNLRKIVVAA